MSPIIVFLLVLVVLFAIGRVVLGIRLYRAGKTAADILYRIDEINEGMSKGYVPPLMPFEGEVDIQNKIARFVREIKE